MVTSRNAVAAQTVAATIHPTIVVARPENGPVIPGSSMLWLAALRSPLRSSVWSLAALATRWKLSKCVPGGADSADMVVPLNGGLN